VLAIDVRAKRGKDERRAKKTTEATQLFEWPQSLLTIRVRGTIGKG
jgi:hypothetical protein